MFQTELKQQFIQHLNKKYPALSLQLLESVVAEQLISPFVIELPKSYLMEIERSVSAFYELRSSHQYQQEILARTPELQGHTVPNFSVCSTLDFHVTPENKELKLVEINTNAVFLALGLEMYESRNQKQFAGDTSQTISSMFRNELALFGSNHSRPRIAVVDDFPDQQKLYCEFLVYREYLRQTGFDCEIFDRRDPAALDSQLIYNRSTDFFLSEPDSKNMREAYLNNRLCFSPNPWEYALLADKTRFIDWTQSDLLDRMTSVSASAKQQIRKVLPATYTVTDKDKDSVWADRKHLFFKPKRSFGSKHTLKGQSITRKAFDEVYNSDFVAQQLISPTEIDFKLGSDTHRMKYDLRCYFYGSKLQSVIARIYQGQVTNLRTPNGGFACVSFL